MKRVFMLLWLGLCFGMAGGSVWASDVDDVVGRLYDRMEAEARQVAHGLHPFSRVEDVRLAEQKLVRKGSDAADLYISYEIFLRGALLGINTFSVGVDVSGAVERASDGWSIWVNGSHRTFDRKTR